MPVNVLSQRIAVVAPFNIGDGYIYLILANNLYKNGYDVTFYHNAVSQLHAYLPHLACKRQAASREDFERELSIYDAVISDVATMLTREQTSEAINKLAGRYIFYSTSRFRAKHKGRVSYQDLRLQKLADATGKIYDAKDNKLSMADHMFRFCEQRLGLKNCSLNVGICAPASLQFQKYNNRIAIHPTSTAEKKNWPAAKFLQLAEKLKNNGYEVAFTVAPNERADWLEITQGKFEVPLTQTIGDLADYLYESRALIGNDSGNGHLASMLGLPVLSIFGRVPGVNFRWRPGWGYNRVARPVLTIKLWRQKRIWKPFLSVDRVYKRFQQLINDTKT